MKVLIAGNLANMGYEIANAMRKKNIDVSLLLPTHPPKSEEPKSLYPDLEGVDCQEWLIRFDKENKGMCNNWKIQIIKEMRKKEYDLIIALTEFSIFALFSGKPYASLSTGSDLRELFFERSLKGLLFRLSYKKAKIIIFGEPDKIPLLNKLGLIKKSVFATAPRILDNYAEKIEKDEFKDKFVIFNPATQDWKLKQNDKLLRAFVKLCSVRDDVYLIASDRGPDIENAKKMLNSGSARGKFQFVPFMDSKSLRYYYNLSDVIVDQFSIGSIGMIAVEAMACEKPVLIKLDVKSFKKCYSVLPEGLINVETEIEIFNELSKLVSDVELRKNLGHRNKKWVENNWDYDKLTDRYISICMKIYDSANTD